MDLPIFRDRRDAGRVLASKLRGYQHAPDLLVLALPRGGVPVAFEVARALHAPLDVFLVRKLGVPGHEELAMGAIASGGVRVLNPSVLEHLDLSPDDVDRVARDELRELQRREQAYRRGRPFPDLHGKTVILVDDGLATGASMRAAAQAVRHLSPARVVVAVPTASADTCQEFREDPALDEIVCAVTPEPFHAVGLSYEDFEQTSDAEVDYLLSQARPLSPPPHPASHPSAGGHRP